MRVMAIDPGTTTGIAVYDDASGQPWTRWELGPDLHHLDLLQALTFEHTVVYETFIYQRRELDKGVSLVLDSCEYIGVIKLHEQSTLDVTLVPQSPAVGKGSGGCFWDDQKLKRLGLWVSSEHERDATRHLLYYVTFTLQDRRFVSQLQ